MYGEGNVREVLTRPREDDGFTLLEITVVSIVLAAILAIGGGVFVSLNNTTARNEAMVQAEQSASTVMTELEHDIRSTQTVAVIPGVSASQGVQLAILQPDGTTTNVQWLYDPFMETLTRSIQNGPSFQPSGYKLSSVTNIIFSYFDAQAGDITSTTNSNIATCTTAIGIDVTVTPTTRGASPFVDTAEVALTNQLNVLTSPGNGQCGFS